MKHSIIWAESAKLFCELTDESLAVSIEPEKVVSANASGMRDSFMYHKHSDGSFSLASHLGSFRLKSQRGAFDNNNENSLASGLIIKSSMPGKVLRLLCKVGDLVSEEQPLLVLEAMKMENEIRATTKAKVLEVCVSQDQKVETGAVLIRLGQA